MARHPKPDPKRKALEESGTANPHAELVHDPAFTQSDFFDPCDLLQVKYEMLRRVRTEGHSVTEAVTRFGMSRPTFYKVQEDFDRAGLVGLLPGKRGPHGPHKITDEVMRFIQETLVTETVLDTAALVEQIRQRFGLNVHRRTVERALARSKKKTVVTEEVANEGMATAPNGHLLAEHYEALRREAVDTSEYPTSVRGLALLMRRGMAAWMKCMRELPALALSPAASSVVTNLPGTVEQSLIDIMATMAFATAMEVSDESRDSFESATATPEEERLSVRAAIFAAAGVRKQREHEASV